MVLVLSNLGVKNLFVQGVVFENLLLFVPPGLWLSNASLLFLLQQVHLAQNLPLAYHTQNRLKTT